MPVLAVYIYIPPMPLKIGARRFAHPCRSFLSVMYYKKAHISWRIRDDTATLPRAPRPRIEQ